MRSIALPLLLLFVLIFTSLHTATGVETIPAAPAADTKAVNDNDDPKSVKKTAFVDPKGEAGGAGVTFGFKSDADSSVKVEEIKKDEKKAFVKPKGNPDPPPLMPSPLPKRPEDSIHRPPSGHTLTAIIKSSQKGHSYFSPPPNDPPHDYPYSSTQLSAQNFLETVPVPTNEISFLHSPPGTVPNFSKTIHSHGEVIICLTTCEVEVTGFEDDRNVTTSNKRDLKRSFKPGSVLLLLDTFGRGHRITHTHELKLMSIKIKKDCLKQGDCGPTGNSSIPNVSPEIAKKLAVAGGWVGSLPLSYYASMVIPHWFSLAGAGVMSAALCGRGMEMCYDWFRVEQLNRKDEKVKEQNGFEEEQVPAHKMPDPVNLVEDEEEEKNERANKAKSDKKKQKSADIDAAAGGF
ncbi:hypothetical protein TrLO_g8631 [Triparma laevis f. longispina]|uniref:Uncharacterized protein n=1 Tax=Triparma laevis f. longispina TaxID=1714387 RepID=A0A9W7AW51_9STRA|nr:hypothetical protein TrLO_g8631 [Triparma laevis f. longispina]